MNLEPVIPKSKTSLMALGLFKRRKKNTEIRINTLSSGFSFKNSKGVEITPVSGI